MKNILKLILIILTLNLINTETGIKIDVSQDVLNSFEKEFIPIVVDELRNLTITDKVIPVDVKVGTLYISISGLYIEINHLTAENINMLFRDPDLIKIQSEGIIGRGHFNTNFKLGLMSYSETIQVILRRIKIDADFNITSQESEKEPGKKLPSGYISRIDIDLNFDFNIVGNILGDALVSIAKSAIKDYINQQVRTKISDFVIQKSKEFIAAEIKKQPIYVPINYKNLALDVSLLSDPKVVNNNLTIEINGRVVKLKGK
jgi:hypothetical protein